MLKRARHRTQGHDQSCENPAALYNAQLGLMMTGRDFCAGGGMDLKTFADFWKGMFFFMSTLALMVLLYLVVVVWQPLWTEGFRDFGNISKAISRLDRTAKPLAEMAPLMLSEMDAMRTTMLHMQHSIKTIEELNPNIQQMTHSMNNMNWVIDRRMSAMNNEMDKMGDKFSPTGMMPFNW